MLNVVERVLVSIDDVAVLGEEGGALLEAERARLAQRHANMKVEYMIEIEEECQEAVARETREIHLGQQVRVSVQTRVERERESGSHVPPGTRDSC